jgi:hypothetical protein
MHLNVVLGGDLAVDSIPGDHGLHGGSALADDASVFDVEGDPQPVHPSASLGYASIAQVHAEQVGIRRRKAIESVLVASAPLAGSAGYR